MKPHPSEPFVPLGAAQTQLPNALRVASRKRRKRWVAVSLALLPLLLGLMAFYWGYPLQPGGASLLQFTRFIELPRTGMLNALDYLALAGDHLMVAGISSGAVIEVPLSIAAMSPPPPIRTLTGPGQAHGIALVDGRLGFVTRSGANTVQVFDPITLQALKTLPVADDPDAVLFDPSTRAVYVASGDSRTATLIDPDQVEVVAKIALPGKPEFALVDGSTGLLYQNLSDVNAIAVINLRTRAVETTWALPACDGPSGMAIDSAKRQLFVVCSRSRNLQVLSLANHLPIANIAVARWSDSVAFDDTLKRVYVASGSGWLTIISQGSDARFSTVQRVRTALGAHTVAVNPKTHEIYVAYAGIFAAPRIGVFEAR